jgi:hypothetical protein
MSRFNFTKEALDALPLPEKGRDTHHDTKTPGLQIRVTARGVKTFSVFARVSGGAPERTTIGRYPAITIDQARTKAKKIISDLAQGVSPTAAKRVKKVESMTLKEALEDYVATKRRSKDGLPLKQRTITDYLKKVLPAKTKVNGSQKMAGELFALADKPIRQITGDDIRKVHAANLLRGERSAAYAAQVLRAVLSWHGVVIPNSPFGKDVAGKKGGITIPKAHAARTVIPREQIGHWWQALSAMPVDPATDYLKFLILTGCRPAEPLKVLVSDCDLTGGRLTLVDTKNRQDHVLVLSSQALAIVQRQTQGKAPTDRLFGTLDPRKTALKLADLTGITFTPKTLRATFASAAEVLVSAYCLKKMMNHIDSKDVTGAFYVWKEEAELREGWQKVADFMETSATTNVVPLLRFN